MIASGFCLSLRARGSGAQIFEIRGDSAHLILRKILDHVVHDRRGAQSALKNPRLPYQIVGVLPGEPRRSIVAARLRTVAGRARSDTLRSDAFFKNLLAAGHELCTASLGPRWCLRGIVGREGLDHGIAKLPRRASVFMGFVTLVVRQTSMQSESSPEALRMVLS
jgi:hypothetical protein